MSAQTDIGQEAPLVRSPVRWFQELLAMNRANRAAGPGQLPAFDPRVPRGTAAYGPEQRSSLLARLRRLPGTEEQRRGDGDDAGR